MGQAKQRGPLALRISMAQGRNEALRGRFAGNNAVMDLMQKQGVHRVATRMTACGMIGNPRAVPNKI